jgi:hypothetical protein
MLKHDGYRWPRQVDRTKSCAEVNIRHLKSWCVLYCPAGKGRFDMHFLVRKLLRGTVGEALLVDIWVTG